MMKLNWSKGMLRFWALLTALWFLFGIFLAIGEFNSTPYFASHYAYLSSGRIISLPAERLEEPWIHELEEFQIGYRTTKLVYLSTTDQDNARDAMENFIKEKMSQHKSGALQKVAFGTALFVLTSLGFLILGISIRWVLGGFSEKG